MSAQEPPPRGERLAEFYGRLRAAPAASSHLEAYRQLCDLLNAVEDELTGIPYDPDSAGSDGRMYPPLADSTRSVDSHPRVVRYRSRGHNTFFGENGSIEIQRVRDGAVEFSKPGQDGKGVWEL